MWTSSTATPAAIEGSCPGGVERKTSTGRSLLPPAASASFPTEATRPGWLATVRASRSSRASRSARAPHVQRHDTPCKQAEPHLPEAILGQKPGELLRRWEAADARRQVRVRRTAREDPP